MVMLVGEDVLFGRGSSNERKRALIRTAPLMDGICREGPPPLGLATGCLEMHPGDSEVKDDERALLAEALQVCP